MRRDALGLAATQSTTYHTKSNVVPGAKDLPNVVPVLGILSIEDLVAAPHVSPRQFVLRSLVVLQLKMRLPEAKMNERVAECSRPTHCLCQSVTCFYVLALLKEHIPKSSEEPRARLPFGNRLWHKFESISIGSQRVLKVTIFSQSVPLIRQRCDACMRRAIKFTGFRH